MLKSSGKARSTYAKIRARFSKINFFKSVQDKHEFRIENKSMLLNNDCVFKDLAF